MRLAHRHHHIVCLEPLRGTGTTRGHRDAMHIQHHGDSFALDIVYGDIYIVAGAFISPGTIKLYMGDFTLD